MGGDCSAEGTEGDCDAFSHVSAVEGGWGRSVLEL